MRPDRIVVGEVRGGEALTTLDALSTGHEGSLLTIHARGCADALDRVASLAARASGERFEELRERARSLFDVIIQLDRGPNGGRRLVELRGRDR